MGQWLEDAYRSIQTNGRWQLLLITAGYGLIAFVTNRFLITAPARHQLMQQIDEERAELCLSVMERQGDEFAGAEHRKLFARSTKSRAATAETSVEDKISGLLKIAERDVTHYIRTVRWSRIFVSLAKVLAGGAICMLRRGCELST